MLTIEKLIDSINVLDNLSALFKISGNRLYVLKYSNKIPPLYGYTEQEFNELIENNPFSFISQFDIEYLKKGFLRAAVSNEKYPFTVQVHHKNGQLFFLSGNAVFLEEENEEEFFLATLLSDSVSKANKKEPGQVVAENSDKLKKLTEFGNIATWDYNIKTKRIINEVGIKELYGFSFANLSVPESVSTSGIIEKDDIPGYLEFYRKVSSGFSNEISRQGYYHFPSDKSPKFLKIKYILEYGDNGEPVMAHGMSMDMTEQKNAELAFNLRANAFLRINPDTILTYQTNISNNTVKSAITSLYSFKELTLIETTDELITKISSYIDNNNDKIHFINTFSRGSLLQNFANGNFTVNLEHSLRIKKDSEIMVRTGADLIKNPVSGDIEAVITCNNINYAKTIENLVNGTVQREYDYIALAYIKKNSFFLIDKYNELNNSEEQNFIEYFKNLFKETINTEEDLEFVLQEFNFNNLVEKINEYGEYIIQYNTDYDYDKNRHKILTFSFLNSRKDIITLSCHDTTKLFNEERLQKKKISDALVQAEKASLAKTEFISLISHDIRTPLNGIMGMNQLALECNDLGKIKEYLNKIDTSSTFLLGLLNNVLDLSKIEAGKVELKNETYSRDEFDSYLTSVIKPICDKKKQTFISIENNFDVSILIDKVRFNQIIFNILTNASKYTNEGGKIELNINFDKIDSSRLVANFEIKDNGIGMTPEFLSHIFENFTQENRVEAKIHEGAGLGMAITYNLVNLMGGDISVESEVNVGSTFKLSFTLPYIKNEEKAKAASSQDIATEFIRKDYTGKTFLLCEDNEINQEIAVSILNNVGANVEVADDGAIGVRKYKEAPSCHFDAIFMDIRMPNMDGMTATKEIRKSRKKDSKTIPIIAMTANAMSDDRIECVEAGMNSFIPKPINVQQMYKLMSELVK